MHHNSQEVSSQACSNQACQNSKSCVLGGATKLCISQTCISQTRIRQTHISQVCHSKLCAIQQRIKAAWELYTHQAFLPTSESRSCQFLLLDASQHQEVSACMRCSAEKYSAVAWKADWLQGALSEAQMLQLTDDQHCHYATEHKKSFCMLTRLG